MRIIVALLMITVSASSSAYPVRKKAARPAAARRTAPIPPFDPKTYAASVSGVDCSNVAARASSIVPVEKVLRNIAARLPNGAPAKDEFETSGENATRLLAALTADFGGADRVIAVLQIKDFMTYDADRGQLAIDLPSYVGDPFLPVKAYSDIDQTGTYNGQNAYGAAATVARETFTQFFLDLTIRNADTFGGARAFKMNLAPDAARSLKETGAMIVVGVMTPPFIKFERAHSSATISDPSDTTYLKYHLTLATACVVISNNGQEIGRYRP